jgi:hypothetical protein
LVSLSNNHELHNSVGCTFVVYFGYIYFDYLYTKLYLQKNNYDVNEWIQLIVDETRIISMHYIYTCSTRMQSWSGGVLPTRVTLTNQISSTSCEQNFLCRVLLLDSIFVITVIFVAAVVFISNNDCFMCQFKHYQVNGEFPVGQT